jgi:hypothetical protein
VAAAAAAVVRLTASAKSMRGKSRAVGGARCGSEGSKAAALRLQSAAQRAASCVARSASYVVRCASVRRKACGAQQLLGHRCQAQSSLQWTRCNAQQAGGSEQRARRHAAAETAGGLPLMTAAPVTFSKSGTPVSIS